jgi:hypothetical protein
MRFQRPKRSRLQRIAILVTGWGLLLVGTIGGLIPIFQGWVFGLAGLLVLASEYEWAHNLLVKARTRWPRFARAMDRTRDDSLRILDRLFRKKGDPPPADL